MLLPKSSLLTLTASLLPSVLAQVPATLSKGFNTQIQVNFKGDSALGFNDGDTIPFSDTANQPVFALGDASGVNTQIAFMIMMLDTTDENEFIMHYLQTDYKATGDKTGLSASSTPKIPYAKPGSFGKSGERKYTFLLYLQESSDLKSTPQAGGKFDYTSFGTANGLAQPIAGIAMNVDVEDAAGSGASSSSEGSEVANATTTTQTMTMAFVKATGSSTTNSSSSMPSDSDGDGDGDGGMTMKPPPDGKLGGGVVSEQPFAASAGNASTTVSGMPSGDGMTPKAGGAKLVGGGVVSQRPFPAATAGNGTTTVSGMPSSDGMTQKAGGAQLVGGGVVSQKPFPAAAAGNGTTIVPNIASIVNSSTNASMSNSSANATLSNSTRPGVAAAVQNEAGVMVTRAGASMAALAVVIGAVAFV